MPHVLSKVVLEEPSFCVPVRDLEIGTMQSDLPQNPSSLRFTKICEDFFFKTPALGIPFPFTVISISQHPSPYVVDLII